MDYDTHYELVALRLPFDETSGSTTVADVSQRPKTVTLVGGAETDTGLFGNAVAFDGTGRVEIANDAEFDFGANDFTIDLAVYPVSSAADQCLFSKRVNAAARTSITIGWKNSINGVRVDFHYSVGGWTNGVTTSAWTLNAWNRIRVSRRDTQLSVHLNGVHQGTTSIGTLTNDSSPVVLGATGTDQGEPFTGWMDEVRIRRGTGLSNTQSYVPLDEPFDIEQWTTKTILDGALRKYVGGETPAPKVVFHQPLRALRNFLLVDGSGRISGTVKEKNTPTNTPLRRRVVLLRDADAQVIDQTFSDAVTGEYEFVRVREGLTYTVLAFDHLHNYRAVVADNLVPTL